MNSSIARLMIAFGLMVSTAACVTNGTIRSANLADHGQTLTDFPRWHEVVPNVHAYSDTLIVGPQAFTTNSLIIVTTEGVVVVDGQSNEEKAKALIDAVRKITPQPVKYIVIASDHRDHTGGNPTLRAAWPEAVFISSAVSKQTLERQERPVPPPAEVVTDSRTLNLGGTQVQILNIGRGHTGGDLIVHLPANRLVFMSELYNRYVYPAYITAHPTEWVATIDKALAMNATWYLPGHGFTEGNAATLKRGLVEYKKALEYVNAEARRLHALGLPCASEKDCPAHDQANLSPYLGWTDSGGQSRRAIARVYAELEGRLPK